MIQRITLDDVLDELMIAEDNPDYETLVRWQQRYPRYSRELADFFATWSMQEDLSNVLPEPVIDEEKIVKKGVEYAMKILRQQGRIIDNTEAEAPLRPFDQLVLTAIYLLRGKAYVVNVTRRVSEMEGREVLLASTFASLYRLEERYLIRGRDADPQTEPGGNPRRYFTVTLAGERALALAKATVPVVARALEGFA